MVAHEITADGFHLRATFKLLTNINYSRFNEIFLNILILTIKTVSGYFVTSHFVI